MKFFVQITFEIGLCLVLIPEGWAQRSRFQNQNLSVHAGLGVANYSGDLNENTARYSRPAVSLGVNYQILPHVAARGEFRIYQLFGSQVGTPNFTNNLSFRSTNPDAWLGVELSALPANRPAGFNAGLYTGIGLTHLSPKAPSQNGWVLLPPLRTEGVSYTQVAGVVPFGLVLTYRFSPKYALQADLSYTYSLSDYLDDVSTVYPDPDLLPSSLARALSDRRPELGLSPNQPGFPRGNPNSSDSYILAQLKLKRYLTLTNRQYRRSLRCLK
ncbi:hypothetical protein [Tellurirhabdus rosea]|uniref:hypothetical protein n=1 Tax=Tellurirhabdus rosea TaxID=2674997 RepID=UPI0022570607|nr:hypothetical protein [Tellurirhabdus rosea]